MPRYIHHPLIHDDEGKKLSKRDFSKGLRDYRAEGHSPESLLGEAAWRVGLIEEDRAMNLEDVVAHFADDMLVNELKAQLLPVATGAEEYPGNA